MNLRGFVVVTDCSQRRQKDKSIKSLFGRNSQLKYQIVMRDAAAGEQNNLLDLRGKKSKRGGDFIAGCKSRALSG